MEVGPRVTSLQILNHQPATLSDVGPRETSLWILAMTLALWKRVFWLEFSPNSLAYWIPRFIRDLIHTWGHKIWHFNHI